jgi:hypothetical protein
LAIVAVKEQIDIRGKCVFDANQGGKSEDRWLKNSLKKNSIDTINDTL